MYSVSQAYLNQIRRPYAFKRALTGTIGTVSFTEDDVLTGSFSIRNQCSDTNEVKIGSVYLGELETTFKKELVQRNQWKDAVITVSDGLWIESLQRYEYVPLGIYTIDDAKIDETGVKVHAYDNMLKFDKQWGISTTIGSPFQILKMLCNDCGVGLGMTQAQIEALPNGTQPISLYTENDCETYRDVLFWLAQTLCCFATIGRDGKLYLRKYGATITDTIEASIRFDDNEFATYETEYSGIGLTNIDDKKYIYVNEGDDDKLSYNLGANPFIQYGTESTRKQMMLNILRQLKVIDYVPFSSGMLHCPAYDLGDVIRFTGGVADTSKISCIMYFNYNFESYVAEGYGSDPALATAADKVDKEIAGLMSRTDKNGVQFYTFKNAEEKTIGDGEQEEFIYIRFTTMDARQVTFQAEILADAEATVDEVVAQIDYYLDGAVVANYQPTETWTEDGKHIISLYYMIDVEPNRLYQWGVRLTADGGTITIPQGNARGTVWGQGLVAVGAWGGFIDVEDTIAEIPLDSITVATFTEICSAEAQIPIAVEIAQQLTDITLDSIDVSEFEDYVLVNKSSLYFSGMTWGDVKEYIWEEIKDYFAW